jgi:ornithine cyclodeaminase/alanine dehydrogenase
MGQIQFLYLSQEDVTNIGLSMVEIIDALEITFRAKGENRTEMPPKPGIHPGGEDNFIHAMPAYIPDLHSAGVKWVSGFPENFKIFQKCTPIWENWLPVKGRVVRHLRNAP